MNNREQQSKREQAWKEHADKTIDRFPERKDPFTTSSEINVNRLYYPGKPNVHYDEQLGFPGQYPYTRGIQPTMYRSKFWTMRQYAGFGSATETNKRFRYLLDQ